MSNFIASGNSRQKADNLLYKYNGLLREIIEQRKGFTTDIEFWRAWTKIAGRINQIQGYQIRHI